MPFLFRPGVAVLAGGLSAQREVRRGAAFPVRDAGMRGAGQWKHSDSVSSYNDAELGAVGEYLKWLAQ